MENDDKRMESSGFRVTRFPCFQANPYLQIPKAPGSVPEMLNTKGLLQFSHNLDDHIDAHGLRLAMDSALTLKINLD